MGVKSKGNYIVLICLKSNCLNRDIKCNICIKFSEYMNQQESEELHFVRDLPE
jgi:hypothetical protein